MVYLKRGPDVLTRFIVTRYQPTVIDLQEAADRVLEAMEGIPFEVGDFVK